jgi:EAL domain-containing protein (putative c-di-GMP-specific phosphodiesterase class I)/FixJ family two-component response regulator
VFLRVLWSCLNQYLSTAVIKYRELQPSVDTHVAPDVTVASSSEHAPSEPSKAGVAFVLDDEVQTGTLVCRVLTACGFEPHHFTSVAPFITELKSVSPDLVALDLALGPADATEVIRHLETLKYKGRLVLIGGRDESTLAEVTQIGKRSGLAMLSPLKKPFRVSDLKERLAQQAKDSRLEASLPRTETGTAARKNTVQLSDALRHNWAELWYQPKIDLKSFAVCGAEALIRARHPQHGVIKPADLFPPAEVPIYRPMSKFVFKRAMADWAVFADRAIPLKLAVNMPVSVLRAPDFIEIVRKYLPTDPAFPGLLIDVAEHDVVRDPVWICEIAAQLKAHNVTLSIDDFGSACAPLSGMKDPPFGELKIDDRFVAGCASDTLKHGLCQTVVDLAHRIGATVCAEAVENTDDLHALMDMGCDCAQGFLLAKPMAFDQFVITLLNRTELSARLQAALLPKGRPRLAQIA